MLHIYISRLDWDDYRIEHIAQHNVEPDEVWEDPLHLARRQGHNRYRVYGQTFDTPHKRAIRVAILPEIAEELMKSAHAQGISIETLVNVFLIERIQKSAVTS